MKVLLLAFCLCAAVVSSNGQSNIIESGIRRYLEQFRLDMQCGFPASGLPILAPYYSPYTHVNIDLNTFAFRGDLYNVHTPHLDTFIIRSVQFNMVFLRMDFDFFFPIIGVTGQFAQGIGRSPGNCAINGNGNFEIGLQNLVYRLSARLVLRGGLLEMGEMNSQISIQSFISRINQFVGTAAQSQQCNRVLESQMPSIFAANQARISQLMDSRLRPIANNFIKGMGLQDLLDVISMPGNPVPCRRMGGVPDFEMPEIKLEQVVEV